MGQGTGRTVPAVGGIEQDSGLTAGDTETALFQLTREGELAEAEKAAREGQSREEFINDQLAYSAAMDEELPAEIEDEAEAREWLGAVYDEAAGNGGNRHTSTEIDETLIEDWRDSGNGKFQNFMELAGATLRNHPGDDSEAALRRELELIANKGQKSGGYTLFENTAISAYNGKEVKESTKRKLITYMSHDMGRFRDLYMRLTKDGKYLELAETEIYEDYETGLQDRGRMSAYEIGRAKEKIRDRALREKIDAGTATDADYRRVIAEADRAAKEQSAEITRLEAEVKADEEKLSEAGTAYARLTRKLREGEAEYAELEGDIEAADADYAKVIREQERGLERARRELEKSKEKLDAKERRLAEAVLAGKERLEKLKQETREAEAERKAAERLLADKRRLLERALKPPSNSVDAKTARKIRALQAGFAGEVSSGRTPSAVSVPGYGKPVPVEEFREKTAAGEIDYAALPKRLQKIYDRKGVNEMDMRDIQAFMNEITYLKAEGRAVLRERRDKARALAKYRVARTLEAVNAAYNDPKARGAAKRLKNYMRAKTPEERDMILRKADAAGAYQQWLEIGTLLESAGLTDLKDLIENGRNEANYQEGQNVLRRYEGLSRLLGDTEKERNRRITELGTAGIPIKGVYHNGRDWTFPKSFLMTASIMLDDPRSRRYILYGHLMSAGERAAMRDALEAVKGDKEGTAAVKARIKAAGDAKEAALREAAEKNLTADDLAIRDYIRDDFTENFDRINEALYLLDNTFMTKTLSYLPLFRMEKGAEAEISVNGARITSSPEKGFTIDRKELPEYAVTDIETDLFKLFYRGVETQEHFAAFAPFVKELNAVFNSGDPAGQELAGKLDAMRGRRLMRAVRDHISVMANPRAADMGSDFGAKLMGKAATGNITWNLLSGLKQFPQSVIPFLMEVKPEYVIASMAKYMGSIGAFNGRGYNAMKEAAMSKSSDLKRRVRNFEADYVRRMNAEAEGPVKRGAAKFAEMGMFLQNAADEFACVSGWDAAYNQKMTELLKEEKLDAAAREKAAVIHADAALAKTQPTTNPMYMSMAFRKTHRLLKYFSTPLAKMTGMAAGIPAKIRRGEGAYVARYIMGTVMVSLAIALLTRRFDDDDEPDELAKKLAFHGLAEPALSHLPLSMFSTSASWAAERLITGEKKPAPQRDFTPFLSIAERAVTDIGNKKWARLARDAMLFSGYLYGMPSAQINRIMQAAEDKDPYAAVAGRR